MPGTYDATAKYLVETYPKDWLAFLGLPTSGTVTVINADLSTVTAELETAPAEADHLRVVTYNLLGLRFPPAVVDQMMPGIRNMRDSLTYQAILEEGRAEGREEGQVRGEQRLLMRLGTARLGQPDALTRSQLESITDIAEIERLGERMLTVSSWSELLADQ